MLQLRHPCAHLTRFESNASFEETLFRLEHALARSPWDVLARVDSKAGDGPRTQVARLFVLAPAPARHAPAPALTWSVLPNEILVLQDAYGGVAVGFQDPPNDSPATDAVAPAPGEACTLGLRAAIWEAAATAAGVPLRIARPSSHPVSATAIAAE
jgi:hypothetical protein